MFALILVVGLSMVRPGPGPLPTASGSASGAAASGGTPPDISQMTPIEAADRLFDRVMRSVSAGDSAAAQQFLPMAIAAYNRSRPLNHDGLFHLSMLNRTAGNLEAALDNALEIVEEDGNHLLGLAAAAEAAVELGEFDEAEVHYRRIAEIYDEERQRPLGEYEMHSQIVIALKDDAEQFLAGR
jgi:tetratricopeptide (TPR) repeat protein